MIAGVQKAGTTALAMALRDHPDLCMSEPKEMHFFDQPGFVSSEETLQDYHQRGWKTETFSKNLLYGEATPRYSLARADGSLPYLSRIQAYSRNIKLIFVFRDPVARLHSQWSMICRAGRTKLSFEEFVAQFIKSGTALEYPLSLFRGHYGTIVRESQRLFPTSQLLFLRLQPGEQMLESILQFLGVDSTISLNYLVPNAAPDKPPIPPSVEHLLRQYYVPEMQLFEELTGFDVHEWYGLS